MAQAPTYTPSTDFSNEERDNVGGRSTVRTSAVDAELANIATSVNALINNQKLNQRDDGNIRDGRVKLFTLAAEVLALLAVYGATPRGNWQTATLYGYKDLVNQGGNTYMAVVPHLSGVFATDLAAGRWILFSLSAAPGAVQVGFTSTATIAATNVQAAIEELDSDLRAFISAAVAASDATLRGDLANTAAAAKAVGMIGWNGLLTYAAGTAGAKLQEQPTFSDKGATAVGDAGAAIQAALNGLYAEALPIVYSFATPLKVPSLSHFEGKRAGIGMTGGTANVKAALKKTSNTTVGITNFQTSITTNIDCLLYIDPAWIDAGVSYPQKASIERLSFQGNSTPNNSGIYIEQAGGLTLRELDFSGCTHGIYAKECWLTTVERVHAFGKLTWKGGTSVTFLNCWTGAGPGSVTGGYDFTSLIYSAMNGCASDGATNTAYRFSLCDMVLNGCGCENASTATADSGTACAFDQGNRIILNGFDAVPQVNQVVALMSVGANNEIQINGGNSYFPAITGVNCPDIYVSGNGSTVIVRDRTFLNGTKNQPVIQFKAGVTTSRVIVHFGDNYKIYTSTGAGNTLVESNTDAGTFTATLTFGGGSTGMTFLTNTCRWQKDGKIVTVSGRIQLSAKGSSTGIAVLGGFPSFAPLGDVLIQFSVMTGITGGPLVGTVNMGSGGQGVLSSRTATGDASATDANFSNSTLLWFNFSYHVA